MISTRLRTGLRVFECHRCQFAPLPDWIHVLSLSGVQEIAYSVAPKNGVSNPTPNGLYCNILQNRATLCDSDKFGWCVGADIINVDYSGKPTMIHLIANSTKSLGAGLLGCVFAQALMAQTLSVPAGLPGWAFNIPDKVQPSAVRPEGIVRANGSAREYEAAKIAGNANPPDCRWRITKTARVKMTRAWVPSRRPFPTTTFAKPPTLALQLNFHVIYSNRERVMHPAAPTSCAALFFSLSSRING